MKKTIIFLVSVVICSPLAIADGKRCGFGSKLFGKSKGIISQLSEISSNELSSHQASVSYGTSGCKHDGNLINKTIGMTEKEIDYVRSNYDELILEMSEGKGETLSALANTLGCSAAVKGDFFNFTKSQYQTLFPDSDTQPVDMLYNLKVNMQNEQKLKEGCKTAII